MILYRFITEWWIENATTDGIVDLLIDGLDVKAIERMVKEFHEDTQRYDFCEFKKYLVERGLR